MGLSSLCIRHVVPTVLTTMFWKRHYDKRPWRATKFRPIRLPTGRAAFQILCVWSSLPPEAGQG